MRMGNVLSVTPLLSHMATRNHSVGINHVTVVPKSPATPTDAAESDEPADDSDS